MGRLTTRHNGVAVIKDKSKHKEAMEKLAQYEEAEEHGSLIKLPFAIGQKIYSITSKCDANKVPDDECDKYHCLDCPYNKEPTIIEVTAKIKHVMKFLEGTFGEHYLATEEEAKKALEKMEK